MTTINTIINLVKLLSITFRIIIFLKNPNIGGIPPKDIKTITKKNLSKNIIEFICVNMFTP